MQPRRKSHRYVSSDFSEGTPSDDGGRVAGGSRNFFFHPPCRRWEALSGRPEGARTLRRSARSVTLLHAEPQVTMYAPALRPGARPGLPRRARAAAADPLPVRHLRRAGASRVYVLPA